MRGPLRWLLALVLLLPSGQLLAAPLGPGERVLLQHDFETLGKNLTGVWALEGQWEPAQRNTRSLRQANEEVTSDSWALLIWSNYTVATKCLAEEGEGTWGLGVMGYVDTAGQGYRLRASEGRLYIEKVTAAGVRILAAGEAKAGRGKWLSLRLGLLTAPGTVTLLGKAWSSDEEEPKEFALRVQDTQEPLSGGSVGLWTGGTAGKFAFVQVRALESMAGKPGDTIYGSDFSNVAQGRLPSGWTTAGGIWARDLQEKMPILRQLAEPVPALFDDNATAWLQWSGYLTQVRAIAHPGPGRWGFGLVSYYTANGGNYRLRTLDNKVYLVKRRPDGRVLTLATGAATLQRGRWYNLKLATENLAGATLLQGKIWEEDQPEPAAWTVSAIDRDQPLRHGWPGLWTFGTAVDFDDFSSHTTLLGLLNDSLL